MYQKPSSCAGCPLQHVGQGFVHDEVRPSSIAIMAFSPSKDDVRGQELVGYAGPRQPIYQTTSSKPFIGSEGWFLTQTLLPSAGLSRDQVSLHHLIKCHVASPPNHDTLLAASHHCVKHHLNISDEIQVLVTMGDVPWKTLQGEGLPLNDWRGFTGPSPLQGGQVQVYATADLKDLFKDPHLRFVTRRDWRKIPSILKGDYPLPIPKQCVASPSTREEFEQLLQEALYQREIMVDTEFIVGNSLLTHVGAAWLNTSLKTPTVKGFQIEWVHGDATHVERAVFMKYWTRLCQTVPMGFWNAKADLPILEKNLGVIPQCFEDPMQAHAVLWPDMPHDYEFVASIYGKYPKLKHLSKKDILLYHWGDMIDLVWIWEALKEEFKHEPKCEVKYRQQNLKVIPIILKREIQGIRVNQGRIESARKEYQALSHASSILAQAYTGFPINLGSTLQLSAYLKSSEGIHLKSMDQDTLAIARSKRLEFDADKEDREGFSVRYICDRINDRAHPLLELRQMYAKNEKIITGYLESLHGVGRVYPQINIHTQAGGRHSITKPALATLPSDLRDLIIPDPGKVWIGWDWDQQEPRIMWGESGSKVLERAFTQGEDIHTSLVCDLYNWEYPSDKRDPHGSELDRKWREAHNWGGKDDPRRVFSKNVRYEVAYDHTEKAYNAQQKAIRMGIDPKDASRAAQTLLNSDPELRAWFSSVMKEGERTYIVRSWGGSRRVFYWADYMAKIPLNEMRNFPMQAGGADLYNLVLVEIAEQVPEADFVYGMHDSQYWSVDEPIWKEVYPRIKVIAEKPRLIGGRMIPFPGSFKVIDEKGQAVKI